MDILTRACWYATWCGASGFKVARRRWLDDVGMLAIATCRGPDVVRRTIGVSEHAAILRC
jgi:hypothetical protein